MPICANVSSYALIHLCIYSIDYYWKLVTYYIFRDKHLTIKHKYSLWEHVSELVVFIFFLNNYIY